ncbi:hypothetical protein Bca52824_013747 [Brassica carinata]|uniref:Uncharacterized protein n=1 Tax=Brassica carinata TaxID=52824 RepID=A0A8X7VYW1_BRACI|nr:hypothetical protein Bca52824_013747 [Brassica carinata]
MLSLHFHIFYQSSMHPPRRRGFPRRTQTHVLHRDFHCEALMSYYKRLHEETTQLSTPRRKMVLLQFINLISIDNEVKYDIKRAFSNDFDGAWWSLNKRAQRIVEEVESLVVSQHPGTDKTGFQGSNSEASITPLMRDEAFNKVVKPHKGRLFGLGTAQMENYD